MSHCFTSQELNVSVTVWKTSFLTLCSFNDLKHPITTAVNSVNRDLVIRKLIVSSCGLAGVFYGFSFFKSCIMKWVNVIRITQNLQLLPFSPSESKDEESEAAFCWLWFQCPSQVIQQKAFSFSLSFSNQSMSFLLSEKRERAAIRSPRGKRNEDCSKEISVDTAVQRCEMADGWQFCLPDKINCSPSECEQYMHRESSNLQVSKLHDSFELLPWEVQNHNGALC